MRDHRHQQHGGEQQEELDSLQHDLWRRWAHARERDGGRVPATGTKS
jgi:hypothetical protein